MNEKEKLTFEEAMNKLENAVNKLEDGEIALNDAFKTFEEGLKLAAYCEETLKNIETKVSKILNDGKEEEFKVEE